MPLAEQHRTKLDQIVSRMTQDGRKPEEIQAVVNDFKQRYGGQPAFDLPKLPRVDTNKVVQRIDVEPSIMNLLTGRYAADQDAKFTEEAAKDPKLNKSVEALRKTRSALTGAGLGAATGGGPVGRSIGALLGMTTTTPENQAGVSSAASADLVAQLMGIPSTKLSMAKRGVANAAAFIGGQKTAGKEMSNAEAGTLLGIGAALPPAVGGLAQAVVTNPVARSLYMRSRSAMGNLKSLLGLVDEAGPPVTETLAGAAGRVQDEINAPVVTARNSRRTATTQAREAVEKAAAQQTKVRGTRGSLLEATNQERQTRQQVLGQRDQISRLEQEMLPVAQQQADEQLATQATSALKPVMAELLAQGHPISDLKALPFLLVRKNPKLATDLVRNPSPENITAAIEMYNVDRAENIYKRLLTGRNPNNYEELLDPETARVAKAVLKNPQGLGNTVLAQYKTTLNKLIPAHLGDIDEVTRLAGLARERNLQTKLNINPPPTPEVMALSGINKTYNATLKSGTATPTVPPEISQAKQQLGTLEQQLSAAQSTTRQQQQALTAEEQILAKLREAQAKGQTAKQLATQDVSQAVQDARDKYTNLGFDSKELAKIRNMANTQPEVFFGSLTEGGEKATTMARNIVRLAGDDPQTRNNLTAGALRQLITSAQDNKGNIVNIAQSWEKNRSVFRELLGDEQKVDAMTRFFRDIQEAQKTLEDAKGAKMVYLSAFGVASAISLGFGKLGAAPAVAAGTLVYAHVKWPQLIQSVLENPKLGQKFIEYAAKAGTKAGNDAARYLAAWASKNGQLVVPTTGEPLAKPNESRTQVQ